MKFKLTFLLLFANLFLFFTIWTLERKPSSSNSARSDFLDFSVLEISGKPLDKPRVLKLENNRWRITSPIDWSANYYAVSRIKNQLEFLDKEASFSVSEIIAHKQTLADFGLDDPVYTFKFGDGKTMREIKIGKSAPVGNRVYLLDENSQKIIVTDKSLVENFAIDIDALRGQNVFDIARFEISAFSIRLAQESGGADLKSGLHRIGLVKEGNAWNFETPITASADSREVGVFLDSLCSLSSRAFAPENQPNTGLDIASFPTAISIQGTNRKQTLLLGNLSANGVLRYARLEDNATVFLVDAAMFKDLGLLQTTLRDKAFFKFDELAITEIDIASRTSSVKLKKLGSGQWDAVGANSAGQIENMQADFAIVNSIISRLKGLRARDFVTDAPGEDIKRFGFENPKLKITLRQANGKSQTLIVGDNYKSETSGELVYLTTGSDVNDVSVYGVSPTILYRTPTDLLGTKSRIFEALPEKAVILKFSLQDLASSKPVFEISKQTGKWEDELLTLPEKRRIAAYRILKSIEKFAVTKYLDTNFSKDGVSVNGATFPWKYKLTAEVKMPGTGGDKIETRSILLTERLSGRLQYGASESTKAVFEISQQLLDSISEFTLESAVPAALTPAAPSPLSEISGESASGLMLQKPSESK